MGTLHLNMIYICIYIYLYICPGLQEIMVTGNYNDKDMKTLKLQMP